MVARRIDDPRHGTADPQPVYNGNPERSEVDALPLFASSAAFQLWHVPAPRPVHESGGEVAADLPLTAALLASAFDRVWDTLRALYYRDGAGLAAWSRTRDAFRPRAVAAKSLTAFETMVDEMVVRSR